LPAITSKFDGESGVTGTAFAFFETAIGRCAILWRGALVVGAGLPGSDDDSTRAWVLKRFPDGRECEPPEPIVKAIRAVRRLLAGEREDFSGVKLDLGAVSDFERRVLEACFAIPHGQTRTYGEIAAELGAPGAAQAVGRALGSNPIPIIIPCHRVVASGGKSGGFSAPGGSATKLKMLQIEGASRGSHPMLFDLLDWAVAPGPRPV
jgi:methylated-DNA-[protein]-cysteine S-methyltransferase